MIYKYMCIYCIYKAKEYTYLYIILTTYNIKNHGFERKREGDHWERLKERKEEGNDTL